MSRSVRREEQTMTPDRPEMRNPSLPGPIAKDTEGEPAAPADPELLVEILPLDGGLADQTGTEDVAGVGLYALLLTSDRYLSSIFGPQSQSGGRKESTPHLPPPPPRLSASPYLPPSSIPDLDIRPPTL